ncbi:MAG: DUF948 domain-containing protein [Bifidobacteriaceae bacterium]|jgi:hypothetical protein|nr:DUF948 domain-containing protein [Bifidobacteriaceae bacterium]
MSLGEIAGLIAAIAFFVISLACFVPAFKLGKLFDSLGKDIDDAVTHSLPLIDETTKTVEHTNRELEKVDAITDSVGRTTQNIAALSDLYGAALGKPIIKATSAFHGIKETAKEKFPQFFGDTDTEPSKGKHAKDGE